LRTLLILAVLLIAVQAKSESWTPLTAETVVDGAFRVERPSSGAFWEDERNRTRLTFISGPLGPEMGSFRTGVFRVPPRFRCFLAGFPRTEGIHIYLRDEETGRELPLGSTLDTGLSWQERIWDVPPDWRGRPVRFHVDDRSASIGDGWVAVTLPEAGSHAVWLPFARAGYRSLFLVLELTWFLIPGIAIALLLPPRSAMQFGGLVITAAAAAGYALFWIYLGNPKVGAAASGVVFAAAIGAIWRMRRPVPRELLLLFAAVALIAVFYNSLGFLFYTDDGPGELAQARFTTSHMPPDNLLQYLFAWDIYNGHSVRPFMIGNARSSDRPPLETALSLAQWPFWRMLSILHSYQLLGVGLQCLWAAALWILLRASGIPPPAIAGTLILILFTGFAWEHSFYVWPKLMAAAFCLIGMASIPAFRGSADPWSVTETLAASAAFSLSLLSHAGSGFTILAIVVYLVLRRRLPPFRFWAPAILVAVLLLAPWRAYQVLIDPPGDTLFKLHLAGVTDEKLSLGASLLRGYGAISAQQIYSNKLANLKALVWWPDWRAGNSLSITLSNLRDLSFFAFFPCAGLLNLGLLARFRLNRRSNQVRFADRILAISLASLFVWCLLMFEPGTAVVHQGSFATVLLYFAAMVLYLSALSRRAIWIVGAVQACIVFPLLVFLEPVIARERSALWNDPLDWGMAAAALCSLLCLAALAAYIRRLPNLGVAGTLRRGGADA